MGTECWAHQLRWRSIFVRIQGAQAGCIASYVTVCAILKTDKKTSQSLKLFRARSYVKS